MYCENDVSAPLEEDLPDMKLGILGKCYKMEEASFNGRGAT